MNVTIYVVSVYNEYKVKHGDAKANEALSESPTLLQSTTRRGRGFIDPYPRVADTICKLTSGGRPSSGGGGLRKARRTAGCFALTYGNRNHKRIQTMLCNSSDLRGNEQLTAGGERI